MMQPRRAFASPRRRLALSSPRPVVAPLRRRPALSSPCPAPPRPALSVHTPSLWRGPAFRAVPPRFRRAPVLSLPRPVSSSPRASVLKASPFPHSPRRAPKPTTSCPWSPARMAQLSRSALKWSTRATAFVVGVVPGGPPRPCRARRGEGAQRFAGRRLGWVCAWGTSRGVHNERRRTRGQRGGTCNTHDDAPVADGEAVGVRSIFAGRPARTAVDVVGFGGGRHSSLPCGSWFWLGRRVSVGHVVGFGSGGGAGQRGRGLCGVGRMAVLRGGGDGGRPRGGLAPGRGDSGSAFGRTVSAGWLTFGRDRPPPRTPGEASDAR